MVDRRHRSRRILRPLAWLACCGALLSGCLDRTESAADLDRRIAAHQMVDGQVGPGADSAAGTDQDSWLGLDGDGQDGVAVDDTYANDDAALDAGGGEIGDWDANPGEVAGPDAQAPDVDVVADCLSSIDCNDGDPCTDDSCTGGSCEFAAVACGPGTACSGGACVGTTACGDGATGPGEQCDDSNQKDGDGCSATCQIEPPQGMVFIEGAQFLMGCASGDNNCAAEEKPAHTVALSAYSIDKKLVTAGQYGECVEGGQGCSAPSSSPSSKQATYGITGKTGHPINYVTWTQAKTYCTAQNRRLCTEAEWEHAARGPQNSIYPWGKTSPTCNQASFAGCNSGVTPAGVLAQGISKYGVLDMAGNVWQWTADGYLYYQPGTVTDPQGDNTSPYRVLRGGSFETPASGVRSTARYQLAKAEQNYDIGFRCCQTYTP